MIVLTTELKPGDVIDWGDHQDEIREVRLPEAPESMVRLEVFRTFPERGITNATFFWAGTRALFEICSVCDSDGFVLTEIEKANSEIVEIRMECDHGRADDEN